MSDLNILYKGFIVSGSVLDNEQRTIAFVSVTDLQTGNTVQTDADGKFSITVANSNTDLRFSHVAYVYDTIKASEFNSYMELYPKNEVLDETIITNNSNKKSSFLLWILGGLAFAFAVSKASTSNKPVKTIKV